MSVRDAFQYMYGRLESLPHIAKEGLINGIGLKNTTY
jgi:hypothetical protein